MKSRILAALAEHGPSTYRELTRALGLQPGGCDLPFLDALSELTGSDRKVVRDEGERAGSPATYRLAEGGRG